MKLRYFTQWQRHTTQNTKENEISSIRYIAIPGRNTLSTKDRQPKLNIHKTFRRRPWRLLYVVYSSINVLCPGSIVYTDYDQDIPRIQLAYRYTSKLLGLALFETIWLAFLICQKQVKNIRQTWFSTTTSLIKKFDLNFFPLTIFWIMFAIFKVIFSFSHKLLTLLTLSCIMLKNGQTYFKVCLAILQHYAWKR